MHGFFAHVWKELGNRLNFSCKYQRSVDNAIGTVDLNGNWNGLIGMLQKGETDVAIAELSMTEPRSYIVDYGVPLISTGSVSLLSFFQLNIFIILYQVVKFQATNIFSTTRPKMGMERHLEAFRDESLVLDTRLGPCYGLLHSKGVCCGLSFEEREPFAQAGVHGDHFYLRCRQGFDKSRLVTVLIINFASLLFFDVKIC